MFDLRPSNDEYKEALLGVYKAFVEFHKAYNPDGDAELLAQNEIQEFIGKHMWDMDMLIEGMVFSKRGGIVGCDDYD